MVGEEEGWVTMLATVAGRQRKILNYIGWNALKQPQKTNLEQKIDDSKPNIWVLSFNFKFSRRKSQSQQILAKKITHFTIQFRSKHLTHLTNLNSLNIVKITKAKKPYSFYKFSSKHVSGCSQKKLLHWTISRRSRTTFSKYLENKCLYIPVYLPPWQNFYYRDVGSFYLVQGFIISLLRIAVWASQNVLDPENCSF